MAITTCSGDVKNRGVSGQITYPLVWPLFLDEKHLVPIRLYRGLNGRPSPFWHDSLLRCVLRRSHLNLGPSPSKSMKKIVTWLEIMVSNSPMLHVRKKNQECQEAFSLVIYSRFKMFLPRWGIFHSIASISFREGFSEHDGCHPLVVSVPERSMVSRRALCVVSCEEGDDFWRSDHGSNSFPCYFLSTERNLKMSVNRFSAWMLDWNF